MVKACEARLKLSILCHDMLKLFQSWGVLRDLINVSEGCIGRLKRPEVKTPNSRLGTCDRWIAVNDGLGLST